MKRDRKGFTLLEVLVAMTIMVIIILMLSAVFRQMTTTWGVGMRKVKANMYSRAAMSQMAQELALAVADDTLRFDVDGNSAGITFYSLNSLTNRAVSRIRYYLDSGDQLRRIVRPLEWDVGGTYPDNSLLDGEAHTLVYNVNSVTFSTPAGTGLMTNLPDYIDIVMQVNQDETVSRAVVVSAGPDRVFNTSDDISSIR